MKIQNLVISVLLSGLILSIPLSQNIAAQEKKQEVKAKKSEIIIIPREVKKALEEGMPTRQVRLDIPFTIIKHLYFPSGSYLHTTFLFKVKNADLGFSPISPGSKGTEKKEETLSAFESAPAQLQAKFHIFLQLNKLENNVPGEVLQEVYIPVNLLEEGISYKPDKEEIYSAGYPLPPGDYLLSMAVTSQQLEKIGTQYYEFSLPDEASLTDRLETTPIFFIKKIENMDSAETKPTAHRGLFTYSILKIEPNFESTFSSGEYLELLFYIFGTQPGEDGKYNIEVTYEIQKGEKKAILYAPGTYSSPLINQPLPLERTVLVKDASGERKEKREVESGKYILFMKITDKISGKSLTKNIDFEVK